MRDGIHTNTAVPANWQYVTLAAKNDADWRAASPIRAARALLGEVRRWVDPCIFGRVNARVRRRQRSLFDTAATLWAEESDGSAPTSLEQRILERADGHANGQCPTAEHLQEGIIDALREVCAGRERDIRAELAVRPEGDTRQVMRRVEQTVAELPVPEYAKNLLEGRHTPLPKLRGEGLDLDGDDLSSGGSQ